MATWRELISEEMGGRDDCWDDVVGSTFKDGAEDREFDDGWGCACGIAFGLWTADYVYFPVVHDGAEWAGSAPRNPTDEVVQHQGGQ